MKLALFDDWLLGVVDADNGTVREVTDAVPGAGDGDPFGAGWWVRMCRDLDTLRPALETSSGAAVPRPLADVHLRAPVLNPGKVVAAASNYRDHVTEMREAVLDRVAGRVDEWLLSFDVFLKATSSIVGPGEPVVLPSGPVRDGCEVHHESELAVVIGRGGAKIPRSGALAHVLGYTIALDMTVRGDGDRSRRKSYDTFTPMGPWIVTGDEIGDPHRLEVRLDVDGQPRQRAHTADLLVDVPGIVSYASSVMRLDPGDVILTGAPAGVGEVRAGNVMVAEISGIGTTRNPVEAEPDTDSTTEATS